MKLRPTLPSIPSFVNVGADVQLFSVLVASRELRHVCRRPFGRAQRIQVERDSYSVGAWEASRLVASFSIDSIAALRVVWFPPKRTTSMLACNANSWAAWYPAPPIVTPVTTASLRVLDRSLVSSGISSWRTVSKHSESRTGSGYVWTKSYDFSHSSFERQVTDRPA